MVFVDPNAVSYSPVRTQIPTGDTPMRRAMVSGARQIGGHLGRLLRERKAAEIRAQQEEAMAKELAMAEEAQAARQSKAEAARLKRQYDTALRQAKALLADDDWTDEDARAQVRKFLRGANMGADPALVVQGWKDFTQRQGVPSPAPSRDQDETAELAPEVPEENIASRALKAAGKRVFERSAEEQNLSAGPSFVRNLLNNDFSAYNVAKEGVKLGLNPLSFFETAARAMPTGIEANKDLYRNTETGNLRLPTPEQKRKTQVDAQDQLKLMRDWNEMQDQLRRLRELNEAR